MQPKNEVLGIIAGEGKMPVYIAREAAQKGVFAAPTVIFYKADGSESARAHSVSELEEIFSLENA